MKYLNKNVEYIITYTSLFYLLKQMTIFNKNNIIYQIEMENKKIE